MPEVRPGSFYYQLRMVMRYLAIAILIAFSLGLFLPKDYEITRSIEIHRVSHEVVDVLKSKELLPVWLYVKQGQVLVNDKDSSGSDLEPGQSFAISYDDVSKKGFLTVVFVSDTEIKFDVKARETSSIVHNTVRLSRISDMKTEVTWVATGVLDAGLFSSYMAMFANSIAGQNFEISLKELERLLN